MEETFLTTEDKEILKKDFNGMQDYVLKLLIRAAIVSHACVAIGAKENKVNVTLRSTDFEEIGIAWNSLEQVELEEFLKENHIRYEISHLNSGKFEKLVIYGKDDSDERQPKNPKP